MLMHAAIWPSCENKNNLEADIADAINAVLFFFSRVHDGVGRHVTSCNTD